MKPGKLNVYSHCNLAQLQEALRNVDSVRFPDTAAAIQEAIDNYPSSAVAAEEKCRADAALKDALAAQLRRDERYTRYSTWAKPIGWLSLAIGAYGIGVVIFNQLFGNLVTLPQILFVSIELPVIGEIFIFGVPLFAGLVYLLLCAGLSFCGLRYARDSTRVDQSLFVLWAALAVSLRFPGFAFDANFNPMVNIGFGPDTWRVHAELVPLAVCFAIRYARPHGVSSNLTTRSTADTIGGQSAADGAGERERYAASREQ